MEKHSQQFRIEVAKAGLFMRFPFFGYIVARLNISEDPEIESLCIDERCNVYYNKDFIAKMTDENLLAVLAHEALHAVFLHSVHFRETIDPSIMNFADDLEVNDIIVNRENMDLPMNTILNLDNGRENNSSPIAGFAPNYEGDFVFVKNKKKMRVECRGKSSIEIYDEIYPILKDENISYGGADGTGNGGDENGDSSGGADDGGKRKIAGGFDEHRFGEIQSEMERLDVERKCQEVLMSAHLYEQSVNPNKNFGGGGCWYGRYIDAILKPQVDWRTVLRRHLIELIPFDYSYSAPAKKSYATGFYEPKILRKPLGVTVCIDVSGSIGNEELREFLSEVVGVAKTASEISIRRLYWSTEVDEKNDEIFTRRNLRQMFVPAEKIHTTGGTSISCVQEYLESHRDRNTESLFIFLTDGHVEGAPKMPKKSLAVISDSGDESTLKAANIKTIKMSKRR